MPAIGFSAKVEAFVKERLPDFDRLKTCDHRTPEGQALIKAAREECGYSPLSMDRDIYQRLYRQSQLFRKELGGNRVYCSPCPGLLAAQLHRG